MRKFHLNSEIEALASAAMPKCRLRWDRGSWWIGWMQLTFDKESVDGVETPLDAAGNIRVATRILQRVIDARSAPDFGTEWNRYRRVLVGLHDEIMPSVVTGCYCCWNHESLDAGYLLKSKFSSGWEAACSLWSGERHTANAHTPKAAIEALWAKVAPPDDASPPWAHPATT